MLFNKRTIKRSAQREAKARIESRDAIVWEVLPSQRLCRVKIQGSNTSLYARYHENWEATPSYLKAGNSVRIAHRGGKRSNWEIIGHGRNLPTFPNPDAGDTTPIPVGSENAILTGFEVLPTTPNSMSVTIGSGTYRINGVEYSLSDLQLTMTSGSSTIMTAGSSILMGASSLNAVTFDTPPASGYTRTDLVVIGTDGVLDVVKGTNFLNSVETPTIPTVPSSHVLVAQVFIMGGKVQKEDDWEYQGDGVTTNGRSGSYENIIEAQNINSDWQQGVPAKILFSRYEFLPYTTETCNINDYPYIWPYSSSDSYEPYAKLSYTLLDQFDREYIASNPYADKLVIESENLGGSFQDGTNIKYLNLDTSSYFYIIVNWSEDEPATFIDFPTFTCYIQSSGKSDPLFTFVNIITRRPDISNACTPYISGDEKPVVVT